MEEDKGGNGMATRIITSIVALPLLIGIVLLGGWVLKTGILFISVLGLYEFYKAVSKKIIPIHFLGFIVAVLYILFSDINFSEIHRAVFTLFIILSLLFLVFMYGKVNIFDVAVTVIGFLYIPFLINNVYLVSNTENGAFLVWLVFLSAWFSDTGAYFVGINFGKHKITPVLSPNKTLEGALGGVFFAALACFVYGFIVRKYFSIDIMNPFFYALIGCVGSVLAQLGDLTASSIKRYMKIKDYGKIIPGHGGIIDRFDSVFFTAPAVYLFTLILI